MSTKEKFPLCLSPEKKAALERHTSLSVLLSVTQLLRHMGNHKRSANKAVKLITV